MVPKTISTRGIGVFLLSLAFLLPRPEQAGAATVMAVEAPPSLPTVEEVSYRIYWNGIRLGKLWLYWKEDGEHYEAKISIKTSGVARVFSKQNRGANVSGRMARRMGMEYYFPEKYEYFSIGKRKTREVSLTYGADGALTETSVNPPDDPKRRPPVSDEARNAAYDPMTALRAILHYSYTLSQGGRDTSSNFTVFDGRRLTKIIAIPAEKGASCGEGCIRTSGRRELLEGYTDKEKEEFEEAKEPPVTIEITPMVSRFPVRIATSTPFGKVYATRYKSKK